MVAAVVCCTISLALAFSAPPTTSSPTRCWSQRRTIAACMLEPKADDEGNASPSPLAALAATDSSAVATTATPGSSAACVAEQTPSERRRSLILGIAAPLAASAFYAFQRLNPVNAVNLLALMEAVSYTHLTLPTILLV